MLPLQFTSLRPLASAVYAATVSAFSAVLVAEPEGRSQ